MYEPCISTISKSGNRLIANIPANFRDEFKLGTKVEIIKVKTVIDRIDGGYSQNRVRSPREAQHATQD